MIVTNLFIVVELDSSYPGVVFYNTLVTANLTSSESTIGQLEDIGISVFIPENSLSSEEESSMQIRPCFTGPFELPEDYEPASPAYLICHSKKYFQKDITIRMQHYANLQTEEDCEDMAFFSASSTPQYRGSRPVYTFKEICDARGEFKPGDQVGEVSLQHFCYNTIGKRKRAETSDSSSDGESSDNESSKVPSENKSSEKKHRGLYLLYGG